MPRTTLYGPPYLYGRLSAADYSRLLDEFRELRRGRLNFELLAARRGEKLASFLGAHGYGWWQFYELPLVEHLAIIVALLGWTEGIKAAAKTDNPTASFLRFVDEQDDEDEKNPLLSMTPEMQALTINVLLALIYSLESIGHFSLSIGELLERARGGDTVALRRAVSVDRMVLATPTASQIMASAQLRRDSSLLSGLLRRARLPHARRRTYVDLRVLQRVFMEANAIADCSMAELLDLIRLQLGVVSPDTEKALNDLFRTWSKECVFRRKPATDSEPSRPPIPTDVGHPLMRSM